MKSNIKKQIIESTKKSHEVHVFLDLDGTVADLYGTYSSDELTELLALEEVDFVTLPLTDFGKDLIRMVNASDTTNEQIVWHVISYVPKGSSDDYKDLVSRQKKLWVYHHLWFVDESNVHILDHDKDEKKVDCKVFDADCFNVLVDDYSEFLTSWVTDNEVGVFKSLAIDVNDKHSFKYVHKILLTSQLERRLKPSFRRLTQVVKESLKRVLKRK